MKWAWFKKNRRTIIAIIIITVALMLLLYKKNTIYNPLRLKNLTNIVPIAVIGSGPAGLSAGLYGARSGFYTVIFQGYEPGGQLTETTMVENWPGVPANHGPELMKSVEQQTKKFGTVFSPHNIKEIDLSSWPFLFITDDDKKIYALTIIIATGSTPRKLGIPGEAQYWGHGVMSCPKCDAPFTKGKKVVIAGGGDTAIEYALQLVAYAKEIVIFMRSEQMRASDFMQRKLHDYPQISVIYNKVIEKITGDGKKVHGVEIRDINSNEISQMPTDSVFLAIGFEPNTKLVQGKLALERNGCIACYGRTAQTSIKGVYAAGTVTDAVYRQAVTVSADGAKAALDAIRFLFSFDKAVYDIDKSRLYVPELKKDDDE